MALNRRDIGSGIVPGLCFDAGSCARTRNLAQTADDIGPQTGLSQQAELLDEVWAEVGAGSRVGYAGDMRDETEAGEQGGDRAETAAPSGPGIDVGLAIGTQATGTGEEGETVAEELLMEAETHDVSGVETGAPEILQDLVMPAAVVE